MLLGGRLCHRHINGRDLFQVKTNVTVAVMREATPDILQVETLILVVDETLPSQKEYWLSDEYVERLLGNLQSGYFPGAHQQIAWNSLIVFMEFFQMIRLTIILTCLCRIIDRNAQRVSK
jgi:hypothetical protein